MAGHGAIDREMAGQWRDGDGSQGGLQSDRGPEGWFASHRVGALQVEPEAAGARREHKYEVGRVGRVELRQQVAPVVALGVAVEPQVPVVSQVAA